MIICTSRCEQDTVTIAQKLAHTLKNKDIILLTGTLGAGKSVFARALIRALTGNPDTDVPSPTFTLVQNYEAKDGTPIDHYDLYRLENPEEIYELGWEDSISEGITIVEWPERLGNLTPPNALKISIEIGDDEERVITYG